MNLIIASRLFYRALGITAGSGVPDWRRHPRWQELLLSAIAIKLILNRVAILMQASSRGQ
jgi:hypothetical protein